MSFKLLHASFLKGTADPTLKYVSIIYSVKMTVWFYGELHARLFLGQK